MPACECASHESKAACKDPHVLPNVCLNAPIDGNKASFYRLKPLDLNPEEMHKPIPLGPDGLRAGMLPNKMKYYVRTNKKPKQRAALALVVRVGSVAETEEERGVAHICEHLAFNGTENYSNHDIVKFLESIGAEFGACQNAYTSADETVYELLVPIDKPGLLRQACTVFAEFATKVIIADADLERERGAVLEEWRQGRTSGGRAAEAHWKLILAGSQYADRLPIGLESVIRHAPASVVRGFYTKWYRPENMCAVVVGDFPDADEVVQMLQETLALCAVPADANPVAPPLPAFDFSAHAAPRYLAWVDNETLQSIVYVSFKHPKIVLDTPAQYRMHLVGEIFCIALNNRFFKISRRNDPPFYNAGTQSEELARPVQSSLLNASCPEGCTLRALEALLVEVARVRMHGFSERELRIARARLLSDLETNYLERDQSYSTDLRDEYVRHFLLGEFVAGQEYEARLARTLLPTIESHEITAFASRYLPECSCVVKTMEHRQRVTDAELKAKVEQVQQWEATGKIPAWEEGDVPDTLIPASAMPEGVAPVSTKKWEVLDSTQVVFPNGLKVVYKCTDFLDDQILVSGFAHGGLSEVSQKDFNSASCAMLLVNEIGVFGFKPELISDILAGKRCTISAQMNAYRRGFSGEQSPIDLENALQLIYLLFTTKVTPVPEDLKVIMSMTAEAIRGQLRDPNTAFSHRVRYVNYGGCYYFKPMTAQEFLRISVPSAVDLFNQSFHNPAEFTIIMVGAVNSATAVPLIEKYLGGIPSRKEPEPKDPKSITALPFSFPKNVVTEEVRAPMKENINSTQITFPVELTSEKDIGCMAEVHWITLATRVLESRLLSLLRFKYGEVYSVSVSSFFGAEAPSREGNWRGDVAVYFSCDPEAAHRLRDLTLEELTVLQEEGPSERDVVTAVELEQRAHEVGQGENSFWMERLTAAYVQARRFEGDVDKAYTTSARVRQEVMTAASPETIKEALRRILPYPCRSRYTAFTLLPQHPWYRRPTPVLLSLTAAALTVTAITLMARRRR